MPGVAIAGCLAEAHRSFAQELIQFQREARRRRLFQDLLMAALDGAVAHAGRPGCAVVVGDDLDLNVADATLDQLFHEDGGIAEGFERLGAGALERIRKLVWRNLPGECHDRRRPQSP